MGRQKLIGLTGVDAANISKEKNKKREIASWLYLDYAADAS